MPICLDIYLQCFRIGLSELQWLNGTSEELIESTQLQLDLWFVRRRQLDSEIVLWRVERESREGNRRRIEEYSVLLCKDMLEPLIWHYFNVGSDVWIYQACYWIHSELQCN